MKKIGRIQALLLSMLVSVGLLLGAIGCSSGDNYADDPGFDDSAQTSCIAEMSQDKINDAQRKLDEAKAQGLNDPSVGVDEVCTINPQTGDMHYYHRNDGLQTYMLYSALMGRSSGLGAMYMLSGGDPFDAILMDSLIGVNRYGNPFYPFGGYDGGYRRAAQPLTNVNVTNVYVGNGTGKKMSYSDSIDPQKSAKFGVKPTMSMPKSSDVTGEGPLSNNGKPVKKVAPVKGLDGQKDAAAKPIKKTAPGAKVVNPAKKGTAGGSSSTGAGTGKKSGPGGSGGGSSKSGGSTSGGSKSGGSGSKSGGSTSGGSRSSGGGGRR